MKHLFVFSVIGLAALCLSASSPAQGNPEANKLARQGSEAAKEKNWDEAVDSSRKAAEMDHKYAPNLAAALQQRATASASQNKLTEAVTDFDESIKLNPKSGSTYEGRAYVHMKMNDFDKALADYSEAIKITPNEARLYQYRGYILETKGDFKGAMADTEKLLKLKKGDADALARKARLETRMKNASGAPAPAPPAPPPNKAP